MPREKRAAAATASRGYVESDAVRQQQRLHVAVQRRLGLGAGRAPERHSALAPARASPAPRVGAPRSAVPSDRSIAFALGLFDGDADDSGVDLAGQLAADDSTSSPKALALAAATSAAVERVFSPGPMERSILEALAREEEEEEGLAQAKARLAASAAGASPPQAQPPDALSAADRDAVELEVEVAGLQDGLLQALAIGESTIAEEDEEDEEDEEGEEDGGEESVGAGSARTSAAAVQAAIAAAESYDPGESSAEEDGEFAHAPNARSRPASASTSIAASLMLSTTLLPSQLRAIAAAAGADGGFAAADAGDESDDEAARAYRPLIEALRGQTSRHPGTPK